MKFTQEISKTSAHSLFTLQVYTFARDLKHLCSVIRQKKKEDSYLTAKLH